MAELPKQDGLDELTRKTFSQREMTAQQGRHLSILSHLRRTGVPATTNELWQILGNGVSLRHFQRDLKTTAKTYGLDCKKQGRSDVWAIKPGREAMYVLPVLDKNAALAFHLAENLLTQLLPMNVISALNPWFVESEKLLAQQHQNNPWYERLTSKKEGIQLDPPEIDPAILATVYLALKKCEQLRIEYIKEDGRKVEHVISPAGIVASHQTLYLLAYSQKHQDYTSYAIHRIAKATLTYTPCTVPDTADFQEYVECDFNEFYVSEDEVTVVADFHPKVQRKMVEYHLAEDQQTEKLSDGWLRVTANLYLTSSLLTWLMGYGNLVRVIGPNELIVKLQDLRQAPPPPPK